MRNLQMSVSIAALMLVLLVNVFVSGQDKLTPLQRQIEQQKQRLTSGEAEERRDALMKLGAIKHVDASRAAVTSLSDPEPMVRVTAAHAITSLPGPDAVRALVPLLKDKLEFVRREAAYALGEAGDKSGVQPLVEVLDTEKEISVRAASAAALGQIQDESAVPALARVLSGISPNRKSKKREDDFVMRCAAQALGQIRSRAGVEILVSALTNEKNSLDVRRAAAQALGVIGDPAAVPALRAAFNSTDPYLSEAARESLRRLHVSKN